MKFAAEVLSFAAALAAPLLGAAGAPPLARDDGWRAKWIAPNRLTRPDFDFGAAKWVSSTGGAFRAEFVLDHVPGGPVEGVAIGTGDGCRVVVNGREFIAPCGFVRDGSRLCRGDVSRLLRPGRNVIEASVEHTPPGTPPSILAAFSAAGRTFFVSDAGWKTFEGEDVKVQGAPRAVPWDAKFDYSVEVASPAFERRFAVKGPVASARLRIAAAGYCEAQLDGVKVGDKVLDPPPTDFRRRILYSEYPVALAPGDHVLRILLGHGWYDMRTCATWNFDIAPWRDSPRTIAELTVRYADGTVDTVGTDGDWRQVKSPVAYDCIREGEIAGAYDPRMPDLESLQLRPEVVPAPCERLERAELPGTKKVREIRPEKVVRTGEGKWTVVFPENFAGWTRFTFRGAQKGDVVTLRYDEHVGPDCAPAAIRFLDCFFYRSGSCGILPGGACQQDRIVASGAPEETFEPRFVYHGFQYVHVSGLKNEPMPDDIVGFEVRTAFEKTGFFECSDTHLNLLVAMADASYRSNFVNGYPTDCPHREKLGWTADAALASRFAQYLYENTAAYRKWIVDIGDAQRSDGALPGIVPTGGWGFALYNGASWDFAVAEVPWTVYEHRGDRRILELAYPAVVKYVKYQVKRCPDGLVDWGIMEDWHPIKTKTGPAFMSTAYFIRTANLAVRMAEVLGREGDRAFCAAAEARSRAAFLKAFAKGGGVFGPGGQTAQAVALNFGLVPAAEVPAAQARLVEACRECDDHVDVGIQGFANLFDALSEMGRTDLAYRVLTRDTSPSPLDWVKGGETTLGDYIRANAGSRNHVMYGTFVAWAFRHLAGIAPAAPGYARAVVAPRPIPALSFVTAATRTPKGEIRSAWKTADGRFSLDVTVPPGMPTEVRLPDGATHVVHGGTHKFWSRL
ncbi:MAG: family 78 glycoside hydrolase catalytic domain [Kiritimatiellae bacterium]|nr:family 78 glycoside hydrolase catalytic domain [Kiritimatiellia bacterium]